MSELRRDPLRQRWVVIAPERARRPSFLHGAGGTVQACPFCDGEEVQGRAITRTPGPEGEVVVVANGFPALRIEDEGGAQRAGLNDRMSGLGAHEVVIETPRHDADLPDMDPAQVAAVLLAWRDRVRDLHRDRRMALVTAFRNRGREAGASVAHPHSQVVAMAVIPRQLQSQVEEAADYQRRHGRCLACDTMAEERSAGARVVRDDGRFISFCPYASATPFEVVILPAHHSHDFADLSPSDAQELGAHLHDVLGRIEQSLEGAAYNLALITSPSEHALPMGDVDALTLMRSWHWRLEILPQIERGGGFERATGVYINTTPPEEAAAHLRSLG